MQPDDKKSSTDQDINRIEAMEVDGDERPSHHRPEPTSKQPDRARSSHAGWRYFSLILFCFLASFLGAWAFMQSGLINSSQTIIDNRETVVSQESEVISEVAARVSPSVVSVITNRGGITTGAGTGFILSADGYVITNKHVVEGVDRVSLVMSDNTSYRDVKVLGRDPLNDIAFLKIDGARDLKPVELGDSSQLKVGDKVIAIGNALGQYQTTVTTGIISGLSRPVTAADQSSQTVEQLENLLQTDAAINPGNSGGPLLTLDGRVIGINTAIAADAEGIGFAIPINDAKGLIKTVLDSGQVARAYLGVRYLTITPSVQQQYELDRQQGAYLVAEGSPAILGGSPAAKAGLKAGDIITAVGEQSIDAQHPLSSVISGYGVGDKVTISYLRDGKPQTTEVTLEKIND